MTGSANPGEGFFGAAGGGGGSGTIADGTAQGQAAFFAADNGVRSRLHRIGRASETCVRCVDLDGRATLSGRRGGRRNPDPL